MPRSDVDVLGKNLEDLALLAKSFPGAYRSDRIREPIVSMDGVVLGHVLDGLGVYLDCDLKDLGISTHGAKRLRKSGIVERSNYRRMLDRIGDEHGAITSIDGIVNARGNKNYVDAQCLKYSLPASQDIWMSTYSMDGQPRAGSYSSIPGGAAKNRTDAGSLALGLKDPTSGSAYLTSFGCFAGERVDMIMVVDLLVGAGGIDGTVNTLQTVSSAALTRYTTGAGVNMAFEVTSVFSGLPVNATVVYTNSGGAGSRSSLAALDAGSAEVRGLMPGGNFGPKWPLQSGDVGIQSVQSIQLASAAGLGALALNLYKPLVFCPNVQQIAYADHTACSIAKMAVNAAALPQDAVPHIGCLTAYLKPGTNVGITGNLLFVLKECWG